MRPPRAGAFNSGELWGEVPSRSGGTRGLSFPPLGPRPISLAGFIVGGIEQLVETGQLPGRPRLIAGYRESSAQAGHDGGSLTANRLVRCAPWATADANPLAPAESHIAAVRVVIVGVA